MTNSLRDQLLGLGFKTAPKPEKKPEIKPPAKPDHKAKQHQQRRPETASIKPRQHHRPTPKTQEEIDLAKAYALRSDTEKQERIEAERLRQEDAKRKRELKAKVQASSPL
jgi:uncharacterized protein YaiL (DUF2058 family)